MNVLRSIIRSNSLTGIFRFAGDLLSVPKLMKAGDTDGGRGMSPSSRLYLDERPIITLVGEYARWFNRPAIPYL